MLQLKHIFCYLTEYMYFLYLNKGVYSLKQRIDMNLDDTKNLVLFSKALANEARVEILKLLRIKELNINEIAETLKIPASSAASHIKVLEEAGIIKTSLCPAIRGSMKVCKVILDEANIKLISAKNTIEEVEIISMPIGNFVDYKVEPTCGIVNEKEHIDEEDEPRCFYNPQRTTAKLIWFGNGYLEYRFSNKVLKDNKKAKKIEISAELCSEDHEYNMDRLSDITMWINHIEVGTWTCPSDFGGRRGRLNPDWWPDKNTQYGILKTWKISNEGCFIDNDKVSTNTISEYKLSENEYISVKIGIKENAKNKGGINLFGDCYGDYNQNIVMKIFLDKN